ncbi:hypothetical protein JKF63_03594 [Porcisia hertigi]|uniref:Uncharacterized protein n=1 Tax=Porcisia hertigi TaxID=2761500 RepID=A0A836IQD5_9TRYP|nr:hypothetical protein JKF63_03594 [Porcisia hertigi]
MLSQSTTASAGTVTLPPSKVSTVGFVTSDGTTAAQCTPPIRSAALSATFSRSLPSPRRRPPQSTRPEEAIASRYLQRLGRTFIRSSLIHRIDPPVEPTNDVASTREGRSNIRKESLMHRESETQSELTVAPLRASIMADSSYVREDVKPTSTVSANRRRRQRSGPRVKSRSNALEGKRGRLLSRSRSLGRGGRHPNPMPYSTPRSPRSPSNLDSSISSSSVASLVSSECGSQATGPSSPRRHGKSATAAAIAAANADALVAKAAALMETAAPPHRRLRNENERFAQVLAQEQSKMLLLVGRHANLESDMVDLLEMADAASGKSQQEGLYTLSMPTAHTASHGAAVLSEDVTGPPRQNRGPRRSTVRMTSSPQNLQQLRHQLEKKGKEFLRNCGTNLDVTHLRELVEGLDNELTLMETILEEELRDVEKSDSQKQPPSPATGAAAAAAAAASASPPRQSLRQRLQHARVRKEDPLEASSNFTRMGWLLESVDAELLTDFQQPQPAERSEQQTSETVTEVEDGAHRQSLLTVNEKMATMSTSLTLQQYSAKDILSHPTTPSLPTDTTATAGEAGKAEFDPRDLHRVSLTATISEPSMVPFSLSDPIHSDSMRGSCEAASTSAVSGRQQQQQLLLLPKGLQDTLALSPQVPGQAARLNLLSFMSDMLGKCQLEQVRPAGLRWGPSLSAPTPELDGSLASQLAALDHQALGRAEVANSGSNGAFSESHGVATGGGQVRDAAGGSASAARRSSSTFSGASADGASVTHSFGADNWSDQYSRSSDPRRRGESGPPLSISASNPKALLGAELRNLRPGLLHDLYELCALHNCVQLIEARRRELSKSAGKGDAEYVAEMEEKLAGHRRQIEAIQRAREEAARREAEEKTLALQLNPKDGDVRTTKRSKLGTPAGSNRGAFAEESDGSFYNSSAVLWMSLPRTEKQPPATSTPPHLAGPSKPTVQQPVSGQAETELLREILPDKGLVFTVVGVQRGHPNSVADGPGGTGSVTAAARADAGAMEMHPKETCNSVAPSRASGSNYFLYYELRVERPLSASPPQSTDRGGPTNGGPTTAASASVSTVASVSVARRRLMNLKMTSGAGASMVDEARGTVVKRSVTPGAPPQVLLRLTPAKPDAGVSYDQAFSFNAEDPSEGAQPQQQPQSWRDGWDVDSPVPGVFAFPLGGLGLQGKSRSSSLDSRKVRSAKGKKPPKGSGAHGGGSASKLARKGTTDKRKPTGSARLPGSASKSSRDHHAHSPNPSSPVSDTEAGEERGRGARASLPQSRDGFSKADEGSLTHPGQLPHTPPLSPVPRPIGEWGVPHAHAEMEAVEKNGVVLAVLQTSEGDDALAKASSADLQSGRGGTDLSAVQRLLAAIPDTEILDLMEGQRSSGAGGGSSEEDGGGGMRMGLMAADTGASLVNNMAEEILSQAMLDGSGGDGHVAGGGRNARGSSVRFDGIGEGVDREGFMDSAQMATKEEMGAGYSRGLSLAVEEGERSGSSHIGGVGADGHASLLLLATDSEGRPLSSTSQQQRGPCGSQRKFASKKPISFGEFTLKDAKSRAFPRVRRAESRAARPAITPAPFFTISSHSHPLLATEGAKYEGGPIRFEHSGDGAADGETTPSLPLLSATKPQHPLKVAGGKRPYRRRGAPESPAASAGAPGEPSVPSDHSELDSTEEGPNMPVPPPVVVVKGAPGRAKPYMMLPDQAAASSLGPSLRNQFALRPAGASPEGRISRENQRAQGDVRSTHSAAESASVSLQQHLTTENSVLPTMGAAAAAAADGETVSHVQKFLEAVKGEFLESSPSGGGFSSQAAGLRSKKPAGGAAGAALFTELSKLQEDARDLFMIDPERFDTVISELMGQAASALRQGFARCTPSPPPSSRGADGAVTSPAHDFPPGGRLPALCHGDSQGVGGTDRLAGTLSDAGEASLTQGKPLNASFAVSATLVQFEAAVEDWNNERGRGDEAALCVGETHPSGAFTRKRDSRTYSAGAGMSALPSRGLMSWLPGNPSQAPGAKPSGAESGIDEQAPLSPSFHSPLHVPRRSTHIFTKADTIAEGGGVLRSLSSADAVTEVERILYEQMKAQVLLRAIIAKMKEMWHTKQQTARAKYRERLVNRRERFMERAMAAAWAVERQRVVHLHKLIYLLDRQVGRVHGWLPHYSDSNVLMDASSFASLPRNMGGAALSGASGRTRAPLASWYRQRNQIAIDAAQDIAGGAPMNVCPRYLHYLPQRRMYCYMHLAKMRRMLPLRLVRAGIHKSHNRHLLLGYNKVLLENPEGQTGDSSEGTQFTGWPHRKLPRRRHDHSNSHATPFQVDRFDDMLTSGERARYRRRLQRTAAFQSVSKMYSPQMKRDADLPFVV